MKVIRFTSVYLLSLMLLASCQGQGVKPQKLDPGSFENKMNAAPDKIILDVRTQGEYKEGHLHNAVLIDFWGDDFKAEISKLDKSKPVFVYCKSGGRSSGAADALMQVGFKQVYNLDGGIMAWTGANKKIEK